MPGRFSPARGRELDLAESDDDGACAPPLRKRREEMVRRLYEALDGKMREIEGRISRAREREGGDEISPADSERDARTLNTLTRLFEKLTDLDGRGDLEGVKENAADPAAKEIDADRFRREIADRLARMLKEEEK